MARKYKELTIHIYYSDMNEGYMYNVHKSSPHNISDDNEIHGGLCTSNAIEACKMAVDGLEKL